MRFVVAWMGTETLPCLAISIGSLLDCPGAAFTMGLPRIRPVKS